MFWRRKRKAEAARTADAAQAAQGPDDLLPHRGDPPGAASAWDDLRDDVPLGWDTGTPVPGSAEDEGPLGGTPHPMREEPAAEGDDDPAEETLDPMAPWGATAAYNEDGDVTIDAPVPDADVEMGGSYWSGSLPAEEAWPEERPIPDRVEVDEVAADDDLDWLLGIEDDRPAASPGEAAPLFDQEESDRAWEAGGETAPTEAASAWDPEAAWDDTAEGDDAEGEPPTADVPWDAEAATSDAGSSWPDVVAADADADEAAPWAADEVEEPVAELSDSAETETADSEVIEAASVEDSEPDDGDSDGDGPEVENSAQETPVAAPDGAAGEPEPATAEAADDATAEAEPHVEPEPEPVAEAQEEPEPTSEAQPDAQPEAEPEATTEPEATSEPADEPADEPVTATTSDVLGAASGTTSPGAFTPTSALEALAEEGELQPMGDERSAIEQLGGGPIEKAIVAIALHAERLDERMAALERRMDDLVLRRTSMPPAPAAPVPVPQPSADLVGHDELERIAAQLADAIGALRDDIDAATTLASQATAAAESARFAADAATRTAEDARRTAAGAETKLSEADRRIGEADARLGDADRRLEETESTAVRAAADAARAGRAAQEAAEAARGAAEAAQRALEAARTAEEVAVEANEAASDALGAADAARRDR